MHGHSLMLELIKSDLNSDGKTLIEIGSTRETLQGQDSSKYFYELSKNSNIKYTTVDMDPNNTSRLKERFPDINAITKKGEDFLEEYDNNIDYLYIDAFDFFHAKHSKDRYKSYEENLGTTINDEECHKMHLDCVKGCIDNIVDNGVIVIDDCFGLNFERGKGVTAIPFLLKNGFTVIKRSYQAVALQKKT